MWKNIQSSLRLSLLIVVLTAARTTSALEPEFFVHSVTLTDDLGTACGAMTDCYNCSNTYSCHWCSFDNQCHAKGSVHGCSWGASCDPPKPKENSTCASHMTCSECALSSHLCHWCEHDNACHAVGSRYGCTTGVDCYSNDRCRRTEPEPFHRWVIVDVPRVVVISTFVIGILLVLCLSCCHYCFTNVKGAYDDLATISMAASRPPSVIGGTFMASSEHFYTTLETHPEEDDEGIMQGQDHTSSDSASRPVDEESPCSTMPDAQSPAPKQQEQEQEEQQHQRPLELESDPSALLDIPNDGPTTPLIPRSTRSFNGIPGMEEPPHMKRLHRMCSCIYYLSVLLVCFLVFVTLSFYPKPPVYNVCNDAVAWKKIMENIVALKLDASFEILISVSNPNHLTVVLDNAVGSFSFDGQPIGTYMIPSETATAMAITDMMLIAKVTPDKYQALRLAEAYYRGNLVLQADFHAKLRVPKLFDYTYNLKMNDIDVYVNELGPRDMCHCPSWEDTRNPTPKLAFLN